MTRQPPPTNPSSVCAPVWRPSGAAPRTTLCPGWPLAEGSSRQPHREHPWCSSRTVARERSLILVRHARPHEAPAATKVIGGRYASRRVSYGERHASPTSRHIRFGHTGFRCTDPAWDREARKDDRLRMLALRTLCTRSTSRRIPSIVMVHPVRLLFPRTTCLRRSGNWQPNIVVRSDEGTDSASTRESVDGSVMGVLQVVRPQEHFSISSGESRRFRLRGHSSHGEPVPPLCRCPPKS